MVVELDLSQYGIVDVEEIVYNPSFDQLFEEETNPDLEGFEKVLSRAFPRSSIQ